MEQLLFLARGDNDSQPVKKEMLDLTRLAGEVLREVELFLQHIDSEGSVFRMNHASNYLTLKGTLNQDRERLLQQVRQGLSGHGLRDEFMRGL